MKSCVFIALIIVFISSILIEESHCFRENKTDVEEDNKNTSITGVPIPGELELVHALNDVDNISKIYENSTTLTNDSSVAGAKSNDNTKSENNPLKIEDFKKNHHETGKAKTALDGENDSATLPLSTTTLAPKKVPVLMTVATTVLATAAPNATPPKDVKPAGESSKKAQETPSILLSTFGPETGGEQPSKSIGLPVVKPSDKKNQVEPNDDKDTSGEEGQPEIDSLNDDVLTDDKKEPTALPPDEKQPVKAPPEHVDSHDTKVADVEHVDSHDKKVADVLPKPVFPEQENSHFFVYFMTVVAICVLGYFLFHNKQKIIALIVEGRHDRRRRAHSYRKLENEGTKGSPAIF